MVCGLRIRRLQVRVLPGAVVHYAQIAGASWRRVHGECHLTRSLTDAGRHNAHNSYTYVSFMPQSYDGVYFGGTYSRI